MLYLAGTHAGHTAAQAWSWSGTPTTWSPWAIRRTRPSRSGHCWRAVNSLSRNLAIRFYAGRYLLRQGVDRSGLAVTAGFTMAADRPAWVSDVGLRISVPGGVPPQRRDALLAVASHCTVHNGLRQEPGISIELDS